MERRDPVQIGGERTQLTQFLDYLRATMLMKVDGLRPRPDEYHDAASD